MPDPFTALLAHVGHRTAVVQYGIAPALMVYIECEDCRVTLHSVDAPEAEAAIPPAQVSAGLIAFACEADEDYHDELVDPETGMCPGCTAPPERMTETDPRYLAADGSDPDLRTYGPDDDGSCEDGFVSPNTGRIA